LPNAASAPFWEVNLTKSYGGLWDKIISWENFVLAYKGARKTKGLRPDVVGFHLDLESKLNCLRKRVSAGTWVPLPFREFECVSETKRRFIQAPHFSDRIVHHAIVRVLTPVFEKKFIYDSYSCRVGKGTHASADRLESFIRNAKAKWGQVYVLKCDVSKFFPSVDHFLLFEMLSKTLREARVLSLLRQACIAPGNITGKGIPIGALTSQLLANVYLDVLDHFLKDCSRCKYYLRYADDFVILGQSSAELKLIKDDIEWLLGTHLNLRLNPKTDIFPLSQGVDFCGYRIWPTHRLPRKRVLLAAKKRLHKCVSEFQYGRVAFCKVVGVLASFLGYMKHCSGVRSAKSVLSGLKSEVVTR
jgi:RNA-directed DNA polymerase